MQDKAPCYRLKALLKETGGGYRGICWQPHPLAQGMLMSLRHRMLAELDSLDASLAGEDAERLSCLACGNMAAPESFGISSSDRVFDPDIAPEYSLAREVSSHMEEEGFVWQRGGLPVSYARALVESLRAAADRLEAMIEA